MKKYNISLEKTKNFLIDLMPKAGEILNYYFLIDNLKSKKKAKNDFVTEADLAVDEFLRNNIGSKFPDIPILSEEVAVGDFDNYRARELLWIIDPLDGTTNFERRIPHFGISCALVSNSKPLLGVVYTPLNKSIYWATVGSESSFCDNKKIYVSKINKLEEAVVCPDFSHIHQKNPQTADFIRKMVNRVRSIKVMGSAVADMVDLSKGKVDVYYDPGLMPWDAAATALIAEKAGARVTDIDGGKWDVFTPGILVANPILHQKILKLLQDK